MTIEFVLGFITGWSCAVVAGTAYLMWRDGRDES